MATETAQHCNKAVNLIVKPLTRPDSQPTGTSGEPQCPAGPRLEQMNWGEEHSLRGPRSLQSLSPYASWGSEGTRRKRRKGGRGGAPAPKYELIPQHLSRGFTDNHGQQTHTHTSPVSQDHRNSICPALISKRPYSRNTPAPSSPSPLPLRSKHFSALPTTIRPLM